MWFVVTTSIFAQKKAPPENWFNLDYKTAKVNGVATEKAYRELLKDKTPKTVIVAVIDGGLDYKHEDLKDVMWINPGEIPDNGIDDDNNGYIDDIYGWNFLGGSDGSSYEYDNLETTRIYAKYKEKFENEDGSLNTQYAGSKEYDLFVKARKYYKKSFSEASFYNEFYGNMLANAKNLLDRNPKKSDLDRLKPSSPQEKQYIILAKIIQKTGGLDKSPIVGYIEDARKHFANQLEYNLNLSYDPRYIVGDDYNNVKEKFYGNKHIDAPNAEHGTHVAGIIGANRKNNIGILGVSNSVRIMGLRVVPDGDERDKDIANAIYYAVDNGAKVINMSFGKLLSPDKAIIDAAVKYAMSKDVLLVHAAGNDAKNIDTMDNYPTAVFEGGNFIAPNWIEVGASSWEKGKYVTANFSNFGKNKVDVFAPGVDINSCAPGSKYEVQSGTSMAAPVTAGVAALLRAYYPELTAEQTKAIILESAVVYKKKVLVPGSNKKKVKLSELCKTGAIVNAYEAVRLAEERTTTK
jgi:subtilisin family serine protease